MQLKLDLGWIVQEGPLVALEEAREELVAHMAAAIIGILRACKEEGYDEQRPSEDRR